MIRFARNYLQWTSLKKIKKSCWIKLFSRRIPLLHLANRFWFYDSFTMCNTGSWIFYSSIVVFQIRSEVFIISLRATLVSFSSIWADGQQLHCGWWIRERELTLRKHTESLCLALLTYRCTANQKTRKVKFFVECWDASYVFRKLNSRRYKTNGYC